jgi:hypothetical protein
MYLSSRRYYYLICTRTYTYTHAIGYATGDGAATDGNRFDPRIPVVRWTNGAGRPLNLI